jgi:hypothetical protein
MERRMLREIKRLSEGLTSEAEDRTGRHRTWASQNRVEGRAQ